jgi:hypothetical protein
MSWNLSGSYVETCSCELMCPCNLSFDHGATYDFCRVTLVFNIREGEIDGTQIGGLKVAVIADAPKVMPKETGGSVSLLTRRRPTCSSTDWFRSSPGSSADPWPRSRRWWARCSVWNEPQSTSATIGYATASESAT